VGANFSPTWKVGRDVDQHIRWGAAPPGKLVRREVPHARSSSSSSLARLVLTRHDACARAAVCGIEPRSRAYLFAAQENRAFDRVFDGRVTASRFGSLPDRGLL
jgi:hypothetical protein